MGLLKKFKNIFVEEVEEDFVPPKKEITRSEAPVISKPVIKKEEIEQPVKVEIEPIEPKKEEKFVFPVYFDDKDFEKIEKEPEFKTPKPEPTMRRENRVETREVRKESNYKEAYNKKINEKEEKKIFKPTPIISPVYGILDKNYYKEDIVVTTPSSRINYKQSSKSITIDDIRNKAFGTLEEDIEQSLLFDDNLEKNVNNKEEDNNAIFDEFDFANAIEEDRKRDLTKDDLKADIEALLENDELTNTLKFRRTKIEEEPKFRRTKIEEEIEDNLEDDIKEELENTLNFRLNETEENTNTELENDFDDIVSKEELALVEEEIELPINVADTEIENAYSDSSDLNDSDLFNLIDSMYDKEDN